MPANRIHILMSLILTCILVFSFSVKASFEVGGDKNWTEGVKNLHRLANESLIEHMAIYVRNDQGQSVWINIQPKSASSNQIVIDPEELTASIKKALDLLEARNLKSQILILHTHPKSSIEAIYSRSSTGSKKKWSVTLPPSRTDLDFIYSLEKHFKKIGFSETYKLDKISGVVVDPTGLYFFRTFINFEERDRNLSQLGLTYNPPPSDFEAEGVFYKRLNEKFNLAVGQWSEFHKSCPKICDAFEMESEFKKLRAMYSSHLIGFSLEFRPFLNPFIDL